MPFAIEKLVCRQEQTSLLNEELTEVRAVFLIRPTDEHGPSGPPDWLVVDTTYEGRDADSSYYGHGLTLDDIDALRIDEAMYGTPETTTPDDQVKAVIADLVPTAQIHE